MKIKRFNEMNTFEEDKNEILKRFKEAKERGDSYISIGSLMTPEQRDRYINRKPKRKTVFVDDQGNIETTFIENPKLKYLLNRGKATGERNFSEINPLLQKSIVNYLNEKLPTLWKEDPFIGRVSIDGFKNDAIVVQYDDGHMEFHVDSDRYRICICLIMKDNEAFLFEN